MKKIVPHLVKQKDYSSRAIFGKGSFRIRCREWILLSISMLCASALFQIHRALCKKSSGFCHITKKKKKKNNTA